MISITEIEKEYGPETALLVICVRCHFKTAAYSEIASFINARTINWTSFRRQARFHRIRPIAYRSLLLCGKAFNGMEDFKAELQQYTLRNWQLAGETERVLDLFEKKNIRAVPYKGTMFSKQFYGDLVSRTSTDIDLIVEWDDLLSCISILKKEGYVPEWPLEKFHGWNNNLKNSQNEYNMDFYKNGERLFHIELHWDISSKQIAVSKKATQMLNYKKEDPVLLNRAVPSLTNASHFITIILHHASKDVYQFLRNLVDIAQAAQTIQDPEEWSEIKAGLSAIGHLRSYEIARGLIESLLGISLLELANATFSTKTILLYQSNLLAFGKIIRQHSSISIVFSSFYKRALQADSPLAKFKQLAGFVKLIAQPNINDYTAFPVRRNLFFVYYLTKPYRLIKRHLIK